MISPDTYQKLDGYCSSREILSAIEDIAADDWNPDDPDIEQTDCHRIWAEPTDDEIKQVEALAWKYADPDDDRLHWGQTTIQRPA